MHSPFYWLNYEPGALTAGSFYKETSYLATLAQSGKSLVDIQESNNGKVSIFGGDILSPSAHVNAESHQNATGIR
ncbi:hypothetical protein [Tunturiibacter lichenicola]|uniref:hypothetical protein n=1 Tax=Tunturiibacter lichenicola TaxID=2051959 RepID=UPI003D9B9A59